MTIPHTTAPRWPDVAPGRFASRIIRTGESGASPEGCRVALLGLPDELGVKLNNGRPGASRGPAAFRAALARYGCDIDARQTGIRPLTLNVFDAGDVTPAPDSSDPVRALEETHRRVEAAAAALHGAGRIVVAVGGGHDLTLPTVRALAAHSGGAVGGINIDPHLDLRDTPGSGMPFRSLIEGGALEPHRFVELGVGRFANSKEHLDYARERRVSLISIEEAARDPEAALRRGLQVAQVGRANAPLFVSFDLDAIDGSAAPGVSAVNPAGFTSLQASQLAGDAGRNPLVRHFDLMELSPPNDDPAWTDDAQIPGRTARLAAMLFLSFLSGVQERQGAGA